MLSTTPPSTLSCQLSPYPSLPSPILPPSNPFLLSSPPIALCQLAVRRTLACHVHELAGLLGPAITVRCLLPALQALVGGMPAARCLLPAVCCPLPTACCLLPTACCPLPELEALVCDEDEVRMALVPTFTAFMACLPASHRPHCARLLPRLLWRQGLSPQEFHAQEMAAQRAAEAAAIAAAAASAEGGERREGGERSEGEGMEGGEGGGGSEGKEVCALAAAPGAAGGAEGVGKRPEGLVIAPLDPSAHVESCLAKSPVAPRPSEEGIVISSGVLQGASVYGEEYVDSPRYPPPPRSLVAGAVDGAAAEGGSSAHDSDEREVNPSDSNEGERLEVGM
ncbi:unnamed protein product [Closterium sp. NIES-54]